MVPNRHLLKALRSLGYRYKRAGKNMDIWIRSSDRNRVFVPRNKKHDLAFVARMLKHAGMSESDSEEFLKDFT